MAAGTLTSTTKTQKNAETANRRRQRKRRPLARQVRRNYVIRHKRGDARHAKIAGVFFSLNYHIVWCPKVSTLSTQHQHLGDRDLFVFGLRDGNASSSHAEWAPTTLRATRTASRPAASTSHTSGEERSTWGSALLRVRRSHRRSQAPVYQRVGQNEKGRDGGKHNET